MAEEERNSRQDASPQDGRASDYDEFVDWDKRLAREAPFFRQVFDEACVRTLIDIGSGSARHSIMFATWGIEVVAVDPDDAMLARAEVNIAEHAEVVAEAGGAVELLRGGFGQLTSLGLGPADAITCTGNALPHVEGLSGLRETLADFASVLRPGGLIVLHLLNHQRLLADRPRTIPPVFRETPETSKIFLRVIGYPEGAEYLDFDFVTLVRDASGEWTLTHRRSMHTALPFQLLERELRGSGFTDIQAFGAHDGTPFDAETDESLILLARLAS
jgi:glycine/sarcosine N-methyltransferase